MFELAHVTHFEFPTLLLVLGIGAVSGVALTLAVLSRRTDRSAN